jgi:hypothetical protein
MGTIGAESATQFSQRLGRLRPGALYVDAPVPGSKGPAEAAVLAGQWQAAVDGGHGRDDVSAVRLALASHGLRAAIHRLAT